jgi:hypothetical protein
MSDLWLIDYEAISDDYTADCIKFGEDEARERARHNLKALGFDPHEIDNHLTALTS